MNLFSESEVGHFYKDKSVFISGATGFLGKVLIEKLLRCCPDIGSLYLLVRSKKGSTPRQRIEQLFNDQIFNRLKEENPNCLYKLKLIEGDITSDNLGISSVDLKHIVNNVSIIFHSAATIKFDEPLRVAINCNLLGTRRVLNLAKQIPKLTAFVHVSTAYANCNQSIIEEVIYKQKITPNQLIDCLKWMTDDLESSLLKKILGNHPNTYTLTKALTELLLVEECESLPVAIIRPAIIVASQSDPYPGWVDNINNISGLILAGGKGILRTFCYDKSSVIDIVPVDSVANLMITVAWDTSIRPKSSIPIYHCSSGTLNPVKLAHFAEILYQYSIEYPFSERFREPKKPVPHTNRTFYKISAFFVHLVPGYLVDTHLAIRGKKRIMMRIYEKLHKATEQLTFFSTRQWQFKSTNVPELQEQLNAIDRETFCFDVKRIHWPSYLKAYHFGVKRFILKEDETKVCSTNKQSKQ